MLLSDTAIRRPVTTLVAMTAMIIFGWISFQNMGLDLFPEVDFPYVTVTTTLIGASPRWSTWT
jgi:HAE1 family hydrophobic/amphiphilic exporter-1